jgi:hypothetical protein
LPLDLVGVGRPPEQLREKGAPHHGQASRVQGPDLPI